MKTTFSFLGVMCFVCLWVQFVGCVRLHNGLVGLTERTPEGKETCFLVESEGRTAESHVPVHSQQQPALDVGPGVLELRVRIHPKQDP